MPEQSLRPKRQLPSLDPVANMPLGRTTSKVTSEGSPNSKWWEVPPWNKVLKQSCSEVFSRDTNLVKEANKEYFKRHSYNFTAEGTHDLSEVFRQMAKSTKLLGSAIYEIRRYGQGWMNCGKLTMHRGLYQKTSSSSMQYPHLNPQRLWDWWAYMTQMPLATSMAWPTVPGVGRRARMRGQLLTTCKWCTMG